jgi:hypothetical protein
MWKTYLETKKCRFLKIMMQNQEDDLPIRVFLNPFAVIQAYMVQIAVN